MNRVSPLSRTVRAMTAALRRARLMRAAAMRQTRPSGIADAAQTLSQSEVPS